MTSISAASTCTPLDADVLGKLRRTSAASIATLLHKRGFRRQYVAGIRAIGNLSEPMVGPAQTLRYIPAREDIDSVAIFNDSRHPQRVAVDTIQPGAVLVMDCRRESDVASCGSILFARLVARGCAGLVTDAGVRDSLEIAAAGMPCFASGPTAPTNLALHHAVEIGVSIGCGGAPVYPGDVMFGDHDGVIVIPRHLAAEIADEALEMEAFEAYALEEVRNGSAVIGLYPPDDVKRRRYDLSRETAR